MAGGSFDQQAEAANRLSGSLQGVEQNAFALAAAVGTLKVALQSLAVGWAMKEIELTAQAFYKLRLSLGVTTQGAMEYTKAVKSMTTANVNSRRALIGMFEELRKSSGMIGVSNKELAQFTTRLQKEFPQAADRSAAALAQMANESPYFQQMMSKNTSASTAFAMANAKFGSEYARVLMAARGELLDFSDSNRDLLTLFAETKASAEDMSQTLAQAFKVPTLGVLSLVKGFTSLVDVIGRMGGGEVGKALGPLAAAGAMWFTLSSTKKFAQGFSQVKDRASALSSGIGLAAATPMRVVITNPAIRVVVMNDASGYVPPAGASYIGPMAPSVSGPSAPIRRPSAAGRAWSSIKGGARSGFNRVSNLVGGGTGAMGLMMAGTMAAGQYESGRQGEHFGIGNAVGAAGTGAMAGLMMGGGPWGALAGAMVGLTVAVIANTKAQEERVNDLGTAAFKRIQQRGSDSITDTEMQMAIAAGGPSLSGRRQAEQGFLRGQLGTFQTEIEGKQKESFDADQKIMELKKIHAYLEEKSTLGFLPTYAIDDEIKKDMARLGVDPEGRGTSDIMDRMNELTEQSREAEERRLELQQKILQTNEQLAKLSAEDFRLAQARAAIVGSMVATLERGYTYGPGEGGLANVQKRMFEAVGAQRATISGQTATIMERLQYGGAGGTLNNSAALGKLQGNSADFLRLLGSSTESEFMSQAGSFLPGATEQELRNILLAYQSQADIAGQINDLEQLRAKTLADAFQARMRDIDETSTLLDLEQQRLDVQISMADALKLPLTVQAQLVERQIGATREQIKLEEEKFARMQAAAKAGEVNALQLEQQTLKIDQLYGQLASQVDYIRRSWEEVFTLQSMNMPTGSYILPTTTGLMERGPAFAPYTPSRMVGGEVAGQGTYESIMGHGRASAFGQLQAKLADAMNQAAGSHMGAADSLRDAAEMLKGAASSLGGSPAE